MPRGVVVLLAICAFAPMGCHRMESDWLVIATSWPRAERQRDGIPVRGVGRGRASGGTANGPAELADPSARKDDPARLSSRRNPPDVLLGGPATSFDRLAQKDRLAPLPLNDSPPWLVLRRGRIRLTGPSPNPKEEREETASDARTITFDDPRDDPISRTWAKGLVGRGQFREGYARLVRAASHPAGSAVRLAPQKPPSRVVRPNCAGGCPRIASRPRVSIGPLD